MYYGMVISMLDATSLHVSGNNDIGDLLLAVIGYMLLSALALPKNPATTLLFNGIDSIVQHMKRQVYASFVLKGEQHSSHIQENLSSRSSISCPYPEHKTVGKAYLKARHSHCHASILPSNFWWPAEENGQRSPWRTECIASNGRSEDAFSSDEYS